MLLQQSALTFFRLCSSNSGYNAVKDKLPGYESGELPTLTATTLDKKFEMHKYSLLKGGFFNCEYPAGWRDIDKGIKELAETAKQRRSEKIIYSSFKV